MNTVNLNPRDKEYCIFAAQPHEPHDVMYFLIDNNIPFQIILGSYKGQRETSYCIPHDRLPDVIGSGLVDDQESILILGAVNGLGERPASLLMSNADEPVPYGTLVEAPRSEAEASEGWSYSIMAQAWFIIKPIEG